MQVYGPAHLHQAQPVGAPHSLRAVRPTAPSQPGRIQDELDLSDTARLVERIHEMPDLRQDRVNQIRAQIASGSYETDEKLEIALSRLIDEIG
jgi:negative regulator of flagellin synthesis FlgM